MKPCPATRPVTCAYGTKGSAWSTGEHGGVDYGTPVGDPVYAMWGGTITGTSWGSAYGTHHVIAHDRLPDGDPGLWAVYAHLRGKETPTGGRVAPGQLIGYSGATGNVSGPHLHVEVQKAAQWKRGNYTNPQPWIDAGGQEAPMSNNLDYKYLGKPSGTLWVGRSYVTVGGSFWTPPRSGLEGSQVYLNIAPVFMAGKTHGALRPRLVREDGDDTGHNDLPIDVDDLDDDGKTLRRILYWEKGNAGDSSKFQLKCIGGLASVTIGTRYTKRYTVVD